MLALRTSCAALAAIAASLFFFAVPAPAQTAHSPMSTETALRLERRLQLRQILRQRAAASPRARTNSSAVATSGGMIETIAGSAPFQVPTTAAKAGLGQTQGVVEDAQGNIYVSTGELRTILKIDNSGNATVYAGKPLPTGPAQASGDGGQAAAAVLIDPTGLAMDAAGNLYIADGGSFTVRKVAATTGIISTIAGVTNAFGHTGDGGSATSAHLEHVQSLVLDGAGNLFLTETDLATDVGFAYSFNGFVREINLSTGVITTVAGAGGTGNPVTCTFPSSPSGCPASGVILPVGIGSSGLAYFQGVLYLETASSPGSLQFPGIVSLTLSSGIAQLSLGGVRLDNRILGFTLATDAAGDLDVTSFGAIYQLPAGGSDLKLIAGSGTQGYAGDGGPAINALLDEPNGISATPSGGLVFWDSGHIRQIDASGIITTRAGDGTANDFGDGGAAQEAGLDSPSAVAVDAKGNVFVADEEDYVVRRIDALTGIITTVAGNSSSLVADAQGGSNGLPGDGGPATQVALGHFEGLAVDGAGNLYIGSALQGVRVVNVSTGILSTLNSSVVVTGGMAFDGNKTLYVGSGYSTVAMDVTTGTFTYITGDPNSRNLGPQGDGGSAKNAAPLVAGLALDGKGNLYVADATYVSVRIVDLSTGIIETLAGPVTVNYNRSDSGDGGAATAATFASINGLSYDGAGHLQIADANGNVIRQVDLATGVITTVAGSDAPGFLGDGGGATAANLYAPVAVAADASANLYIADSLNDRVRRSVVQPSMLAASLTSSSDSLAAGTSVTFTATFTGLSFGNLPALGLVSFDDGTTLLTGSTVTIVTNANGFTGTLTNSSLAVGTHSITARFAGDGNYAAVTSAAVTVTVAAPPPLVPSFSLSASPTSLSIVQGAIGTAVITLTPVNAFNQAVTFGCQSMALAGTTPSGDNAVACVLNPGTVTTSGTTAVTARLSFEPPVGSAALAFPRGAAPATPIGQPRFLSGGAAGLACLLMLGLPRTRRRSRGLWLAIAGCVLLAGSGLGCGSDSGANAPQSAVYPFQITATAGTGAGAVSQSVMILVTVTK